MVKLYIVSKKPATIFIALAALLAGVTAGYFYLSNKQVDTTQKIRDLEVLNVKDERMVLGNASNTVPIVEYADVLCPYCAVAHRDIMPKIKDEYIDTQKAFYELRLVGIIRPESKTAAHGAYCAAEQDRFWDYIDLAYKETWDNYYSKNMKPEDVTIFRGDELDKFAQRAGVDIYPWQQCMKEDKYEDTINSNQQTMASLDGYGTPFFIFNEVPYGSGVPSYEVFKSAIDAEYRKLTTD